MYPGHQLVERDAGDCNFTHFLTHKRKRSHSERETVELFEPTQPTCLPELACDDDIPTSSVIYAEIMGTVDKREMSWYQNDSPSSSLQQEYCQSMTLCCEQFVGAHSQSEGEAETFHCWERWMKAPLAHKPRVTFGIEACWSKYCLSVLQHNGWSKSKTPDRLVAKIMKYRCTDKLLHFDDPQ